MYATNARLYFKHKFHLEPDTMTFIGAYPEDDPVHFVFEFEVRYDDPEEGDNFTSYIVTSINSDNLLTREVQKDELEHVLKQQADPNVEAAKDVQP